MNVPPARHGIHHNLPGAESSRCIVQLLFFVSMISSSPVFAQQHDAQMSHDPANMEHNEPAHAMTHGSGALTKSGSLAKDNNLPVQGGQSAFAAIAEIVTILDNDPDTDWASVDIDALRSHLVEMDRITLNARATTLQVDDQQIQYVITGKDETLTAIHNMVPAHAQAVQSMTHWNMTTTQQTDGATVTIQTSDKAALTRLKALGFHGFLTIGAHHQAHHLQMARGVGH